jgi:hypothetical protein
MRYGVKLEEAQVEFTQWFAEWLRARREGRPRQERLAFLTGERRSGMTFAAVKCCIAAAFDLPGAVVWIVTSGDQERHELDQLIRSYGLSRWVQRREAEWRLEWPNGSVLRLIGPDDHDSLKRGDADIVFYSSAEKLPHHLFASGVFATSERDGLVIVEAKAPQHPQGQWVTELKNAIESDLKGLGRSFAPGADQ